MTTKNLLERTKALLRETKSRYSRIQILITTETISFDNANYLSKLGELAALRTKLDFLGRCLSQLRYNSRIEMVVAVQSKIKLVSTKVGAVIWVDARNYVDFIGKSIGDVVMLYNSPYLIAGIY